MTEDLNAILENEEKKEDVITVDLSEVDEEENEEVIDEVSEEEMNVEAIPWFQNLSEIEDEVSFIEFENYEYKFKSVSDPSDEKSGKFLVFYKDNTQENPNWVTLNSLLSERYTVAKSEPILQNTIQNLNFSVEDTRVLAIPFKMGVSISTNCPINLFSNDAMKSAFQIVTGIGEDELNNNVSKIDVIINNSYDGTSRVNRSYSIKTSLQVNGLNRIFRDYFLLSTINESFIHVENDLGSCNQKLRSAQETLDSTINILSNITENIDEISELISKKLNKNMKKSFNDIWDNIPTAHRNMLLLIVLLSNVIEESFDFNSFISIRPYIERIILNVMQNIANN